MFSVPRQGDAEILAAGTVRPRHLRGVVFIAVFLTIAGGGLLYDYSRPAIYRATSRISIEPPGIADDAAKAQFALNEGYAMHSSELMRRVATRLQASGPASSRLSAEELEASLSVEHVPNTTMIELSGQGRDKDQLVSALSAWIEVYRVSRKSSDRAEESDALEQARHEAKVAVKAIQAKQRDMESYRQQHGIVSTEREENPSASRLRGLNGTLNEAAAREVKAEARLKAVQDGIAQGRGVIRVADKGAIANLEMRAVELREKIKDLEQGYTAQFLVLDPKHKALKSNLARMEQQIEQEKERSQKAALDEAQEDLAQAAGATAKLREQINAVKLESQSFSTRFAELKRMGVELEQLEETRRAASERLAQLESARKPAEVRIRMLSAPSASDAPIAPEYTRDAGIALAAGLVLATLAVWLTDYLRREAQPPLSQGTQPIIQIAYPSLPHHYDMPQAAQRLGGTALLGPAGEAGSPARELHESDVAALWENAPEQERLLIAALFGGIAPSELRALRWANVDIQGNVIRVPGPSARTLVLTDPLRVQLRGRAEQYDAARADAPLFADGVGNALDESILNAQLACVAHDAGLRHPEEVTARSLQFTYAAFLARQGIRMVDLVGTIGRVDGSLGAELMRLAPHSPAPVEQIERTYPSFRSAMA